MRNLVVVLVLAGVFAAYNADVARGEWLGNDSLVVAKQKKGISPIIMCKDNNWLVVINGIAPDHLQPEHPDYEINYKRVTSKNRFFPRHVSFDLDWEREYKLKIDAVKPIAGKPESNTKDTFAIISKDPKIAEMVADMMNVEEKILLEENIFGWRAYFSAEGLAEAVSGLRKSCGAD